LRIGNKNFREKQVCVLCKVHVICRNCDGRMIEQHDQCSLGVTTITWGWSIQHYEELC